MRVFWIVPVLVPLLAPGQTPRPAPTTPSSSATAPAAKSSPAAAPAAQPSAAAAAPAASGIRAAAILEEALKDKNPDTRKQAVQSIGLVGPREPYVSRLDSMLGDKDVEVRLATVASLLDLNDRVVLPMLRKALNDEVPEVSFAAAKALWAMNDPQGKGALLSVLNGEMKTSSGFITTQKRDALRMIHTPKTMFMFAVKEGVGLAPVPGLGAGVSSVQGILSDPTTSGRAATALLIGMEKDPQVLSSLKDALGDKEWSVRAAAVHSLAVRGDPAEMADLLPLFDDKKEAVRMRAAAGYVRLAWIKALTPPKPAPKAPAKKRAPAAPAVTGKSGALTSKSSVSKDGTSQGATK